MCKRFLLLLLGKCAASLIGVVSCAFCVFGLIPLQTSKAAEANEVGPLTVSPPVTPGNVTVPPESMQTAPRVGAPVTVPEGEPLPKEPPPRRVPVADPTIQLKGEKSQNR